jgi:hypothetical protein
MHLTLYCNLQENNFAIYLAHSAKLAFLIALPVFILGGFSFWTNTPRDRSPQQGVSQAPMKFQSDRLPADSFEVKIISCPNKDRNNQCYQLGNQKQNCIPRREKGMPFKRTEQYATHEDHHWHRQAEPYDTNGNT